MAEWSEVMSSIFSMQLPWHSLRAKLAKVNSAGLVEYHSTFEDFKLQLRHHSEVEIHAAIAYHVDALLYTRTRVAKIGVIKLSSKQLLCSKM